MNNKVFSLIILGTDGDVCAFTLEHLLAEGMDKILIDLVPVEDNTADIVHDLQRRNPSRIEVFPSEDVSIWGSRRMTRLAHRAHDQGAEWILPNDADEFFTCPDERLVADVIRESEGYVFGVPVYMHVSAPDDDEAELNPYRKMRYRSKTALGLNKIFLRYNPKVIIDEGNHGAHWQSGAAIPGNWTPIQMRHYPYRTEEQFVRKVIITEKAMQATPGYPQEWGVHYRVYADTLHRAGPEALKEWFTKWFRFPTQNPDDLMIDPVPWRS